MKQTAEETAEEEEGEEEENQYCLRAHVKCLTPKTNNLPTLHAVAMGNTFF